MYHHACMELLMNLKCAVQGAVQLVNSINNNSFPGELSM